MAEKEQKEEYKRAIAIIHKVAPYTLQRRDPHTEEWFNWGSIIHGRATAYAKLAKIKKTILCAEWRVLPTNEAERYREGFKHGAETGKPDDSYIPTGMYLPEHL